MYIQYIYIFICDGTYRNIICASNFACALSSSPTMLWIQLVLLEDVVMSLSHRVSAWMDILTCTFTPPPLSE